MATKKEEVIETQEIAIKEEAQLAFSLDDFSDLITDGPALGFEISGEDIVMPKVKLVQATSLEAQKGQAKMGEFYNVTTGEVVNLDDVTLLCMGRSRIRFAKPFKRGEAPLCRSFDGICSTDGVVCKGCQYSDWDKVEEGQSKPDCTMGYTWLAVPYSEDGGFGVPFRIIVAGAGISELKKFITNLAATKLPPFVFRVSITSEQVESDGNIFYVPKFKLRKTEDGKLVTINPVYKNELKNLTDSWVNMMNQISKFDLENSDEMASEADGAIF